MKTKLAVPAVIVLLAAAAAGYQLWSQHEARAALDETLATLPSGTHGRYDRMSFNVFTHTLRIGGLAVTRDGHPALTIGAIALHHLSGTGTLADPYQASGVRLIAPRMWRGSRSVSAAVVDVQDLKVLAPGVPPPPGTPAWLEAPGSGTVLAAGSITATGIADDQGASLAALFVQDFSRGRIGQASARGFADSHGNRIATATADAVDLDGLDAVFDTSRYTGEPSWPAPRPLIGHAEIVGFQSQGAGGSITIDSLMLDRFAARPFATAPTAANMKRPAFLRGAATDIALGAASLQGLRYQDDRTKLSGSLGAIALSAYADGALGQASLTDLSTSGPDAAQVAIGQLSIAGLNATKLLSAPFPGAPADLIAAARDGGVRLRSLALARLSVTPAAGGAASGHPASDRTVTIGSITQATTGTSPTHFSLNLHGLSIPGQSNPELAQGLGALGVERLVLDLDETGSYDTAAGTATLAPIVITARGLGSLSLTARFAHVPREIVPGDTALAAFQGVEIGPFTARFTNHSLIQRIIDMEAQQTQKTTDEVTDEAKLAGSFAAAALVPGQSDAGDQIAAFLADPQSFTITATPAAPIPLRDFLGAGRAAAQSALNLKLSAN